MLLELFASGITTDQILAGYVDLEADDVLAALEHGALTAGARQVITLRAGRRFSSARSFPFASRDISSPLVTTSFTPQTCPRRLLGNLG